MTPEEIQQAMTMLVLKFGSIEDVIDMSMDFDERLSAEDLDIITRWLVSSEEKPYNLRLENPNEYSYIVAEIPINLGEED